MALRHQATDGLAYLVRAPLEAVRAWLLERSSVRDTFDGADGVDVARLERVIGMTGTVPEVLTELSAALGLPRAVQQHLLGEVPLKDQAKSDVVQPGRSTIGAIASRVLAGEVAERGIKEWGTSLGLGVVLVVVSVVALVTGQGDWALYFLLALGVGLTLWGWFGFRTWRALRRDADRP